jgi:hypothetical protein
VLDAIGHVVEGAADVAELVGAAQPGARRGVAGAEPLGGGAELAERAGQGPREQERAGQDEGQAGGPQRDVLGREDDRRIRLVDDKQAVGRARDQPVVVDDVAVLPDLLGLVGGRRGRDRRALLGQERAVLVVDRDRTGHARREVIERGRDLRARDSTQVVGEQRDRAPLVHLEAGAEQGARQVDDRDAHDQHDRQREQVHPRREATAWHHGVASSS